MDKKFKIGRYYKPLKGSAVLKYIDKENDTYFFKRIDGTSYGINKCGNYNKSSRLCKKCTKWTTCSCDLADLTFLKEIPYLKAILLYEEVKSDKESR